MPTHGSPAAARQANARARPRAGVSGPAHRPRPAQPSAPAPVQDPALTSPPQSPDSYPHTSPPHSPGDRCLPLQLPQQHPGLFANVSLVMLLAWPPEVLQALYLLSSSPHCPFGFRVARPPPCPHTCCSAHLSGLGLKQLAPAPGFPLGLCSAGPSPHSGSGSTASHPRDPLLKQPPIIAQGHAGHAPLCWTPSSYRS
ncbi:unnamed protein product [Rangifer tarandus platyrhynchus]|uniref:Uncharacterized protein n=1 Tax=Rangifer tarandus platyrhynchus TaxID=3082113 RepID=A0ABN8YL48_RANTA|nr:unnamed protein product [Rangifer tarandus platyrhynchus]